jgi:cytochrome c-type biogenesis protein CcmH/NrfF
MFALAIAPPMRADGATNVAKPSLQDVSEGLACQCGCGLTVANCNHPNCSFSVPIRGEIAGMIARGSSRGGIISAFRAKYGEKILSAPPAEGFNLLAWLMPLAVVMIGAALIVLAAIRWRSKAAADVPQAGAEATPGGFDPRLRRRLERELHQGL